MFTHDDNIQIIIVDYPSLLFPDRPILDPSEMAKFNKASNDISNLIKSLGFKIEIPDHSTLYK